MFINALSEARDGFASGSAQGAIDAFAQTRADIQTRNTYSTIAGGAMKWVPLLNIVLTVVFYSLFPILFLLMLLPTNGMTVAKGYITGFFYLAALPSTVSSSVAMTSLAHGNVPVAIFNATLSSLIGVFAILLAFYVAKRQPAVVAEWKAREDEAKAEAQPVAGTAASAEGAAPVAPPAGSPLAEALAKTKAEAEAAEAKLAAAPAGAPLAAATSDNGGKA